MCNTAMFSCMQAKSPNVAYDGLHYDHGHSESIDSRVTGIGNLDNIRRLYIIYRHYSNRTVGN